jgi:hypothetical protein
MCLRAWIRPAAKQSEDPRPQRHNGTNDGSNHHQRPWTGPGTVAKGASQSGYSQNQEGECSQHTPKHELRRDDVPQPGDERKPNR